MSTTFQSNSSNIATVSFVPTSETTDGEVGDLVVSFRSGRTYAYSEVPVEVYEVMEAVELQTGSCGSHFSKTVRNVYDCAEVTE